MPAKIYYDNDADLSLLKDKTIAILGFGSQGHAQALNLRDSGCNVIISELPDTPNYDLAVSHGFEPLPTSEAAKRGDIVQILLPDEIQADVYRNLVRDHLETGNILLCSHGFNVHFGQVEAPAGVDTLLVAPKGPGHLVRSEFEKGGGVPCLVATGDGASDETLAIGEAVNVDVGIVDARGAGETHRLLPIFRETEHDRFRAGRFHLLSLRLCYPNLNPLSFDAASSANSKSAPKSA